MSLRRPDGWQGRFGKGRIVQALLGSRTRAVLDARLDELSTYGLLREQGSSYVNELFQEMQNVGLLTQTRHTGSDGKDYQLVALTPLGDQVMRGQSPCQLAWPEETGAALPARRVREGRPLLPTPMAEAPLDAGLLDALKKKREDLARAEGVPRYVIFPDETLRAFERLRPKDGSAGRRIRGVGEVKAERYLPAFLEVIREYGSTS
jgi:ATP-dependent DNA helicase RecQ